MLEILALMMLCNKNKSVALQRGRKPIGFVVLTVLLWFGLEIIGGIIGYAAGLELGAYVMAVLFAATGGAISYLIVKSSKPGDYVAKELIMTQNVLQNAQPLEVPAQIVLVRESSMMGAVVNWDFSLNGQPIGILGNGKNLTAVTAQRQNILRAKDAYGSEIAPFVFDVESGSAAEIIFKVNRFLPEKSRGILLASVSAGEQAPVPVMQQTDPYASQTSPASADQTDGEQVFFCIKCGKKLAEGAAFCGECGEKRFVPQESGAL